MVERAKTKVRLDVWEGVTYLTYWCPGCESIHRISIRGKNTWTFDSNYKAPTFNPSVLVTYQGRDAGVGDAPPAVCHCWVRSGVIEFLPDCTHALKGQKVPLPYIPDEYLA